MKSSPQASDFIEPLHINGLNGRVLVMPAKSSKAAGHNILLLYGHHALLERWWGLVENLHEFGNVTMPDLPGFGGMDGMYKIGRRPTIDAYADYLAAFIKLKYNRKRLTIVGISFGFVVATRMLQRYPELARKVDLVVSIVGFMHRDDFLFGLPKQRLYRRVTRLMATRLVAFAIRYGALNKFVIKQIYVRLPAGRRRFIEMTPADFTRLMDFEVELWQRNDVRTHWLTTSEFLWLDNCSKPIKVPAWHVTASHDHYFNNHLVEQHMQVVYQDYNQAIMDSPAHTPSILGDKRELGIMLPPALRKQLKRMIQ